MSSSSPRAPERERPAARRGSLCFCRAHGRLADEEQGRVVVQPAAHMGQQFLVERAEGAGRLRGDMPLQALGQGVEGAASVAGLGDAVGVEQQLVALGEGERVESRGVPREVTQSEGRRRVHGIHRGDAPAGPHQQRGCVPAVHHLQLPLPWVPGDHGGHEVVAAEVAGEAPLDPVDDGEEVGLVVGGFSEDTEHQRGGPDGGQPLAAHVADDQPHPVRGGYQRVQVTADTGLRRGGAVADGHLERPDGRRYGFEQGVLGGLRDRSDGGEHPLPASAQHAGQAARERDGDQGRQHGGQFPARHSVPDPERRTDRHGEDADAEDPARSVGRGRQGRPGREQGQPDHPGPADEVGAHDGGDDHDGKDGCAGAQLRDGAPAGRIPGTGHPVAGRPYGRVVVAMVAGLAHVGVRSPHLCAGHVLEMSDLSRKRGECGHRQGAEFQIVSERVRVTRLAVGSSRSRISGSRERRFDGSETPREPRVSPL